MRYRVRILLFTLALLSAGCNSKEWQLQQGMEDAAHHAHEIRHAAEEPAKP